MTGIVARFDDWLGEEVGPRRGVVVYVALVVYYGWLLIPIVYLFFSTFKTSQVIRGSKLILVPVQNFTLAHWTDVLTRSEFQQFFWNSVIVSSGTTVLAVVFGTLAAYSVSRMEYPGRGGLIVAFLGTSMFPPVLVLIPFFLIMFQLHIINTYVGLIVAMTVITLPFSTWLLKGYFDDIPRALDDAAKIDGCSEIQTLYRIIVPLALPGIAVAAFYSFVVSWNNYIFVSILSTSANTRTLPFALQLFQSQHTIDWGSIVTAATVTMIPVVVLFAFVQNYLVEGLTSSGMKGP